VTDGPARALRRLVLSLAVLLAGLAAAVQPAGAHALDPGYLDLAVQPDGGWLVHWRVPDVDGRPMPIRAVLPETCAPQAGPAPRPDGRAWAAVWRADCPGGIAGGRLVIDGLADTATDVLVRFDLSAGVSGTLRLTAAAPEALLPEVPSRREVAVTYAGLGVTHILEGADHLLFVLLLILLVRGTRRLVATVTAFTLGHSLSLAAATLGWIALPSPPVEAVIALSIMFLARDLALPHAGNGNLTDRFPWLVAAGFGLLHGLGFAGALREIGLPQGDVPLALLAFNLGVEAGQLLFIAVVLVAGALAQRLYPGLVQSVAQRGRAGSRVVGYGAGSVAALWFVQRLAAF
jgi:hydrogenase/urease accessory protein HupE